MFSCPVQDIAFFHFCSLADIADLTAHQRNHAYHLEFVVEVELLGWLAAVDAAENRLLDHDCMPDWELGHPEDCEMAVHHLCFSLGRLVFPLASEAVSIL